MIQAKKLLKQYHFQLSNDYPVEEIDAIFYKLLEFFHHIKRLDLAMNPNLQIDEKKMLEALKKLSHQEPWQYITGKTEFFGLLLKVNKNVLIPRPETEELVDWIIKENQTNEKIRILDIGTGSGAIAIALAKKIQNSEVFALDIDSKVLEIATNNASINNVDIHFFQQNILDDFLCKEKFDIMVSNPPYVRESEKQQMKKNVLDFEPELALFVSDENPLIFYDRIMDIFMKYSSRQAKLYFEINEYLKPELTNLLQSKNFVDFEFRKDIFDKWRMLRISGQ